MQTLLTPRSRFAACVLVLVSVSAWATAVYAQSNHSLLLLLSRGRLASVGTFHSTNWENLTTNWDSTTGTWN